MWYLRIWALLGALALLSACGGGDVTVTPAAAGTGAPAQEVTGLNGIWEGDYTDSSGVICTDLKGLIYNGNVRAVSESCNVVFAGTLSVSGSSANINFDLFDVDGASAGQAAFSGSFTLQSSIDGSLDNGGQLSLRYQPVYENNSSLSLLATDWLFVEALDVGTILSIFSIDSAGVLPSLTTRSGCNYAATFSILDPDYNLYAVNLTITSCSSQDGVYSGVASLSGDNRTMTILAGNDQNVFFTDFLQRFGGAN